MFFILFFFVTTITSFTESHKYYLMFFLSNNILLNVKQIATELMGVSEVGFQSQTIFFPGLLVELIRTYNNKI